MKKYLQLSFMCLLVLTASVFGSCKDDDAAGSPSPLLGLSVKMAEADSTVLTVVNIDQANKAVTISLSKEAKDLQHVTCSFDLVNGASLYTPFVTNPVMMDLSQESGVNITTGNEIVCYKIIAEVDYAIKSVKATSGESTVEAKINQKKSLIDVYFGDNEYDPTQVNMEFVLSAVSSMIDPAQPVATMDLSADTTYVKVNNEFNGETIYKIICWGDPAGDYLPIKADGATITETGADAYSVTTTAANASITTSRFPIAFGSILSFEYKTTTNIGRPVVSLDVSNPNLQLVGYELKPASDWTSYVLDMGGIISDGAGSAAGFAVNMTLGQTVGTTIEIRNVQVRERTAEELIALDNAYIVMMIAGGTNSMTFEDLTTDKAYQTYKLTPTGGDPFKRAVAHENSLTPKYNQLYFEYKAEADWSWEIFWREIGGFTCYPSKSPQFPGGQAMPGGALGNHKASDIWVAVHMDMTTGVADLFKAHSDAGAAAQYIRWDLDVYSTNKSITIRHLRLEQSK